MKTRLTVVIRVNDSSVTISRFKEALFVTRIITISTDYVRMLRTANSLLTQIYIHYSEACYELLHRENNGRQCSRQKAYTKMTYFYLDSRNKPTSFLQYSLVDDSDWRVVIYSVVRAVYLSMPSYFLCDLVYGMAL